MELIQGNHLFVYNADARDSWFESITDLLVAEGFWGIVSAKLCETRHTKQMFERKKKREGNRNATKYIRSRFSSIYKKQKSFEWFILAIVKGNLLHLIHLWSPTSEAKCASTSWRSYMCASWMALRPNLWSGSARSKQGICNSFSITDNGVSRLLQAYVSKVVPSFPKLLMMVYQTSSVGRNTDKSLLTIVRRIENPRLRNVSSIQLRITRWSAVDTNDKGTALDKKLPRYRISNWNVLPKLFVAYISVLASFKLLLKELETGCFPSTIAVVAGLYRNFTSREGPLNNKCFRCFGGRPTL